MRTKKRGREKGENDLDHEETRRNKMIDYCCNLNSNYRLSLISEIKTYLYASSATTCPSPVHQSF
jgi:hypothetical protein